MEHNSFKRKDYTILIILGMVGMIVLVFSTKWGIGISPDSTIYIGAARNFLGGHGLGMLSGSGEFIPMTTFPPLYPILLSLIGLFGVDPLDGAKWLNVILFGSNITLVGFIIKKHSRSSWASIFGSFLMLTSVDVLLVHSMVMTESVFIFFALLGMLFMANYVTEKTQNIVHLVACSIVISLAFLTRYIGVTLVIVGLIGIFLFGEKRFSRRVIDCLIFAIISCSPMIIWMARNLFVAQTLTDKKVFFHPCTYGQIRFGLVTASEWLLPASTPGVIRAIVLLGVIVGLFILAVLHKTGKHRNDRVNEYFEKTTQLIITFLVCYIGVLFFCISFVDADVIMDQRILSPVFFSLVILGTCLVHKFWSFTDRMHAFKVGLIVLCIAFAGFYLFRGATWVIHSFDQGHGYGSKVWRYSETIEQIRALPARIPIFSNGADAVYILTGRFAYPIPAKMNPTSGQINDNYLSELNKMRDELERKDGVLVYFYTITWRWYLPSDDELKKRLQIRLFSKGADGSLYKVEKQGTL